jgi:hypothetical protein
MNQENNEFQDKCPGCTCPDCPDECDHPDQIPHRPDLLGAHCEPCIRRLTDWGACHTCKERPFGSTPCLDTDENIDCPNCPNEMICGQIAAREWSLAEIAVAMFGGA